MSFFSRLFSAPEQIVKITDAVIKSGDALVFTDEERAEFNLRQQALILELHKTGSGSHLARRLLAVMVAAVFLAWFSIACFAIIFQKEYSADLVSFIFSSLFPAFGGVMLFYFGSSINRDRK